MEPTSNYTSISQLIVTVSHHVNTSKDKRGVNGGKRKLLHTPEPI